MRTRESEGGFDKSKSDIEMLSVEEFRRAIASSYNKEDLAASVSPSRYPAYGLIGGAYIYDPENGLFYRDTETAKQTLAELYSIDTDGYFTEPFKHS